LTGDAAAAARLVGHEVKHLNRLVEDLIEISRFDAGTVQLVTDETDVGNAVSQCLRARGWPGVSSAVPAGLIVRLDRRRFDVILANLIGNALRHGGPPVTVQARIQSGGQLAVEVRDHGHGLPPAAIPHIFDRFYKADTARTRSDGSGLGLAIAWENARLHGGHIHAGNHPDGGAVFNVSLPLTGQDRDDVQVADAEHVTGIAAPLALAEGEGTERLAYAVRGVLAGQPRSGRYPLSPLGDPDDRLRRP